MLVVIAVLCIVFSCTTARRKYTSNGKRIFSFNLPPTVSQLNFTNKCPSKVYRFCQN